MRMKAKKTKLVTNGETIPLMFKSQLNISLILGSQLLRKCTSETIPVVNQYPLIGKPSLFSLPSDLGKYFIATSDKKIRVLASKITANWANM